jgi:hypothetical protein
VKRTSLIALVSVCAASQAQTPEWYASRFGLCVQAPAPSGNAPMTQFRIPKFMDAKQGARSHNDPGIMSAQQVALTDGKFAFNDPRCAPWAEMLEVTDKLPANTWLRLESALNHHFYNPFDKVGLQEDRLTQGLVGRLMYRNSNVADTLNLLLVCAPGINAHTGASDSWTRISVDPSGKPLQTAVTTKPPKDRDWWRPEPAMMPYLKSSFQKYVNLVNDAAAVQARQKYGNAGQSLNFVQKIGFQIGNEPGTGHPGGSQFAKIGSWDGLGRVNEGFSVGINYGVSPAVRAQLGIPASFGTNPLTMPAFSFLNENANQISGNYVGGKLMNFQNSGAFSPGVNEVLSYGKEMNGFKWSQQCGRRALHFRSPVLRWRFFKNDFGMTTGDGRELLHFGPQDPRWGRWETAAEYAKRWVTDLELGVDMIAGLPMPAATKVVDVTETYFINGDLGAAPFDANMKDSNGANINFANMTLDQVRDAAKTCRVQGGKFSPLLPTQIPPTRKEILVAIRNELYQRDVVQKNLSKNLGRIFIWSSVSMGCREMTGLNAGNKGDIVGYNPWNDFRLNPDEMKALWGIK